MDTDLTEHRRASGGSFAWVRKHVALLFTAAPIAIAAFRIMAVSGGDPVVLKTLTETLSFPTILMGTFLPLLPVLLLVSVQQALINEPLVSRIRGSKSLIAGGFVLIAGYALFGSFPTALWTVGALLFGLLSGELLRRWLVRRAHLRGAEYTATPIAFNYRPLWFSLAAGAIFLLVMPFGMWLPLEKVDFQHAGSARGYILSNDEGWTTMLTSSHAILRFTSSDMSRRTICDQGDYQSLATMILNPAGEQPPNC